jgi:hypothetical protein
MRILIDTSTRVETKRSGVVEVQEALSYLLRENEEGEATESPTALACRAIVGMYLRQKALDDDKARARAGKVAAHLYAPRLNESKAPEAARRTVVAFKKRIVKALGTGI